MKKWSELKRELLEDKQVRDEYQALEPEYTLARALLKARLAKKMTQAEVAARAGISQVMVARLESGVTDPRVGTVNRVAKVLGKELKLVRS